MADSGLKKKLQCRLSYETYAFIDALQDVYGLESPTKVITRLIHDAAAKYKLEPIDKSAYAPDPAPKIDKSLPTITRQGRSPGATTASGFYGVYRHASGKWRAVVTDPTTKETLTEYHTTPLQAAKAYDRMAIKAWGPGTKTNFPYVDPIYIQPEEMTDGDDRAVIVYQRDARAANIPQRMVYLYAHTTFRGNPPKWVQEREARNLPLDIRDVPNDVVPIK